jgi:acetyl-CoA carboxylase biotin carboxyl carrier protein
MSATNDTGKGLLIQNSEAFPKLYLPNEMLARHPSSGFTVERFTEPVRNCYSYINMASASRIYNNGSVLRGNYTKNRNGKYLPLSLTFNAPLSIKTIYYSLSANQCKLRFFLQSQHYTKGRKVRMSKEIVAPMPGTVINILVNVGDEVLEYQEVLILEAMKMENAIPSAEAGTVKEIKVNVNDKVATNQVLMVLE